MPKLWALSPCGVGGAAIMIKERGRRGRDRKGVSPVEPRVARMANEVIPEPGHDLLGSIYPGTRVWGLWDGEWVKEYIIPETDHYLFASVHVHAQQPRV